MGRRKQRKRSGKKKPQSDKSVEQPTPDSSQGATNLGFESDTSVSDNELHSESQDGSKITLLEYSTHEELLELVSNKTTLSQETSASVSQQDTTETTTSAYSEEIVGDLADRLGAYGVSDTSSTPTGSTEGVFGDSDILYTTSSDQETADSYDVQAASEETTTQPPPESQDESANRGYPEGEADEPLLGAVGGAPLVGPVFAPSPQGPIPINIGTVRDPLFILDESSLNPNVPAEWHVADPIAVKDTSVQLRLLKTPLFQTQKKADDFNKQYKDVKRTVLGGPPDPTTLLQCDQCSFTTRRSTALHDHKAEKHRREDKRGKR